MTRTDVFFRFSESDFGTVVRSAGTEDVAGMDFGKALGRVRTTGMISHGGEHISKNISHRRTHTNDRGTVTTGAKVALYGPANSVRFQ